MPRTVPMTPTTITAVKPTTMETRAPKMSRESTSRPRASAKIAASATVTRIAVGTSGNPSIRKGAARRQARVRVAARLPFIPDPRVDDGVQDVHQEVDDHDHRPAEQDRRLHHREVAEGDALVEQAAHAGPGKHRLDRKSTRLNS